MQNLVIVYTLKEIQLSIAHFAQQRPFSYESCSYKNIVHSGNVSAMHTHRPSGA